MASIAGTYGCSPPAISYVVSRSRAKDQSTQALPPAPPSAAEPHLVKVSGGEGTVGTPKNGHALAPADSPASALIAPQPAMHAEPLPVRRDVHAAAERRGGNGVESGANGFARNGERGLMPPTAPARTPWPGRAPGPTPAGNDDQRRTLHLGLGNGGRDNGGSHHPEPQLPEPHSFVNPNQATLQQPHAQGFAEARPVPDPVISQRSDGNGAQRKDGGSYIDKDLRARVDGDIAAFLAAFDAALAQDTQESRAGLREATDRLLRAGARTRIELERLEARLPLVRVGSGRSEPDWRPR